MSLRKRSNSRSRLRNILLVLICSTMLTSTFAAYAQSASQIVLNFLEVSDAPDQNGLAMRIYFTLADNIKKPVTNAQIKEATIALDPEDGGNYKAKVSNARDPISLVLVLDTSGSMRNTFKKMLEAAADLVKGLPQGSKVAVIQFSTKVEVVQTFTADLTQATDVISGLKAGGTTCLFDATYRGVELLATGGISGRRAVVVFTDGKDENGAGKPCSQRSTSDIAQLATDRRLRVPIYSIGLRGSQPIAEADLRNISESTGGALVIGDDVTAIFKQVVDALNAQYVAEAIILPRQGEHNVSIRLILNDDSVPTAGTGVFSSPKDYSIKPTATPLPVVATISTIQQDPATGDFILSVETQSSEFIKRYKVEFIDNKTNLLQKEFTFNVPPLDNVHVPSKDVPSGEYNVQLTALDAEGKPLSKPSAIRFQYTVPTAVPTIAPTAIPEATDFISRLGKATGDPARGPFVFGIIIVVTLGLLLTLAALFFRRPQKAATGTGFLREMTGAVDVHQLQGYTPSWSKGGEQTGPPSPQMQSPQAQQPYTPTYDSPPTTRDEPRLSRAEMVEDSTANFGAVGPSVEATNVMPYMEMPRATLTVTSSRDSSSQGKMVVITHTPYNLGRTGRDLNFEADGSVSRDHASITFENGLFYLTDKGSTNKSRVNGNELLANTPVSLQSGVEIQLGSGTKLKFQVEQTPRAMDGTISEPLPR